MIFPMTSLVTCQVNDEAVDGCDCMDIDRDCFLSRIARKQNNI